jgi:hypothetical protein
MKVGETIGSIVKGALLIGCIYWVINWQYGESQDDEASAFAEKSCVGAIGDRYDVATVRAYSVTETNSGHVVRASITLPRGTPAKVYCVTNEHGRAIDIGIQEQ